MKKVIITVDLEDWFQVENLRPIYPHPTWDRCDYRVEDSTRTLLDLFERQGVKATFFVLGWVARRSPALIREIESCGHEIASHGFDHTLLAQKVPQEIREDILRSKELLEEITGVQVLGYRAPSFTISLQLLNILKQIGFKYDSSLNNFSLHGRYGTIDQKGLHRTSVDSAFYTINGIYEFPVTNLQFGPKIVLPWAGGGYFRLIPCRIFLAGVKRILAHKGHYVFYCHPWEFDPAQPRVKGMRWHRRVRHYIGLERTLKRLNVLIEALKGIGCEFSTCRDELKNHGCCAFSQ